MLLRGGAEDDGVCEDEDAQGDEEGVDKVPGCRCEVRKSESRSFFHRIFVHFPRGEMKFGEDWGIGSDSRTDTRSTSA